MIYALVLVANIMPLHSAGSDKMLPVKYVGFLLVLLGLSRGHPGGHNDDHKGDASLYPGSYSLECGFAGDYCAWEYGSVDTIQQSPYLEWQKRHLPIYGLTEDVSGDSAVLALTRTENYMEFGDDIKAVLYSPIQVTFMYEDCFELSFSYHISNGTKPWIKVWKVIPEHTTEAINESSVSLVWETTGKTSVTWERATMELHGKYGFRIVIEASMGQGPYDSNLFIDRTSYTICEDGSPVTYPPPPMIHEEHTASVSIGVVVAILAAFAVIGTVVGLAVRG